MKEGRSFSSRAIGTDLVEYARARELWRCGGPRLKRILTASEWSYVRKSRRPDKALACLLAAKEAVFKSLDQTWMGPENFQNIRIKPGTATRTTYTLSAHWPSSPVRRAGTLSFKRAARYVVATCAGT